ncbi:amidohydrolase family protein [Alicyclobacillus sp. SO9]|uniref:amidohydrolase family protein n=1 Tax=Alicyclobacillus sp. SO9 TaxID=2665646 RepID=UPI0018E87D5B|nr:amidohydrolase family protein [Alicyclobacillus sp. SO9]QQE77718.1 amidohydrolase family protein [Alicyclobacillus sp. SO9]
MYDVHTHFVPPQMTDWISVQSNRLNAVWEKKVPNKQDFLTVNGKWSFEFKREFHDSELFLQSQADAGVLHSLVSPIPQLFLYDFDPAVTAEAASVYNRGLATWVKNSPARLSALGTVPLNNPSAAAQALVDALGQGLKGAIVGPGLNGRLLSDPWFEPLWQQANAKEAILFIHPLLNEDPRLKKNKMPNLIGVPWETTICALDLILTGHLDRFPKVKVLLAHGGGFLPYQIGRYNQGYQVWDNLQNNLQGPPEDYLTRFYYDNVLWNEKALSYLVSQVGEKRVLPGSDFPFDLKTWPPASSYSSDVTDFLKI